MQYNQFVIRHIGVHEADETAMLKKVNCNDMQQLIHEIVPSDILNSEELVLDEPLSEYEALQLSKELSKKNSNYTCYIGMGYHPTLTPPVIQRNILENPGWYTAYTPYQAEIAQGRLEALLNYQTLITELTGLPIANASLLDEATAAAEAMTMLFGTRSKEKINLGATKFFVDHSVLPQTLAVLETKAYGLGIEIVFGDFRTTRLDTSFFGCILQYPAMDGSIRDYAYFIQSNREQLDIRTVLACDILALLVLKSPADLGADVAVGTSQRFGIPMGYGGPHAAFFATKDEYKRHIPGRIIGVSIDKFGKRALRMALQTREQHIKREKATSNICTAQVLLSVMAGMYALHHGKNGLFEIAQTVHEKAKHLYGFFKSLGLKVSEEPFFDTVYFELEEQKKSELKSFLERKKINANFFLPGKVTFSINELTGEKDLSFLKSCLAEFFQLPVTTSIETFDFKEIIPFKEDILQQDIFHKYTSETELMRYIKRLERKDLALNHSMIPLGSCTMKLNAAVQLLPLSWPEWGQVHPFVPAEQAEGYQIMIKELEDYLSKITGFAATSLQPNSGAQGEYTGLMVIKRYLESIGEGHRNVVLIPQSAHGTNPASAVLAGMKVVVVKNNENGSFDMDDMKSKLGEHGKNLAALMITYPSTYGFYDENVKEITNLIHQYGGQVYMDGANMNAQVGITSPGNIGADVCHLNLHKTFAIPHGGGGPGVGPICVAAHLAPFLPKHPLIQTGGEYASDVISAAPYGSSLILNISYIYIKTLGAKGLRKSTEVALLNANYLKELLQPYYPVLYTNSKGRVAHELIIDCRQFKSLGIEVTDIAKRLMDYGFHAPTVSFPVAGTMMIEPTESESKEELDRFAEAMISIRHEIDEIANGVYSAEQSVLKNAPHTLDVLTADTWEYPYSREKAAFPLKWVRERKFFASVSRIDEGYGDRNLVCTCEPIEHYQDS